MSDKSREILNKIESLPPTQKSIAKGMLLGAAAGSVVPVIGTSVGTVIGGIAGLALKLKKDSSE